MADVYVLRYHVQDDEPSVSRYLRLSYDGPGHLGILTAMNIARSLTPRMTVISDTTDARNIPESSIRVITITDIPAD